MTRTMKRTGRSDVRKRYSSRSVLSTLKRHRSAFTKTYSLKALGVFGSHARGDQKVNSDVDILVDFHETPDLLTFVKLADELEAILHRRVDLVRTAALRGEIKEMVLKEAIFV